MTASQIPGLQKAPHFPDFSHPAASVKEIQTILQTIQNQTGAAVYEMMKQITRGLWEASKTMNQEGNKTIIDLSSSMPVLDQPAQVTITDSIVLELTPEQKVQQNFESFVEELRIYLVQQAETLNEILMRETLDEGFINHFFENTKQHAEEIVWYHSDGQKSSGKPVPHPENAIQLPVEFFDTWIQAYEELKIQSQAQLKGEVPAGAPRNYKARLQKVIEMLESSQRYIQSLKRNYISKYGYEFGGAPNVILNSGFKLLNPSDPPQDPG